MEHTRTAAKEISLAEKYDADGAHDNAIGALARATKLGDVEATTRLAKRLIVGDRAPLLPADGTRFLIDAANKGGAEAAARLAVLCAAGVYVQPSLDRALELLSAAAERGWEPAQNQLLTLTPDRELASRARAKGPVPKAYWRELLRSVKPADWMTAPRGRTLHESPLIRVFESFLAEPVCQWLIERSRDRLKRALVYDAVGGKEIADHTRTNTVAQFDLMDTELVHVLVQMRMSAACGVPLHNMEATAVLHYAVGEQITNHYDFVNPKIPNYANEITTNGQRILTFLIYLNDDYDGGETVFPKLGVSHKGRRGDGLFFTNALENGEPDLRTVHAGCPPSDGEKWIVSQFVRNRRLLGVER